MGSFKFTVKGESYSGEISISHLYKDVELMGIAKNINSKAFDLCMMYPYNEFFEKVEQPFFSLVFAYKTASFIRDGKPSEIFFKRVKSTLENIYEKGKYYFEYEEEILARYKAAKAIISDIDKELEKVYGTIYQNFIWTLKLKQL